MNEIEVLVSSRDEASVSDVPARAALFATAARRAGWTVRATYALAVVPKGPRKPEHRVHSYAVRISRPGSPRGFATWWREERGDKLGPWAFDVAFIAGRRAPGSKLTAALTWRPAEPDETPGRLVPGEGDVTPGPEAA